jgi:hypothetical protein
MSKTNYERNRSLNGRYGDGTYTKPGVVYVGLQTSMPTVSSVGTEVAGGGYGRVAVTNDGANFPDPVAGVTSNAIAITFAQATAAWGTVVGASIWDALTGGNMQDFAPLDTPKVIANGDTFSLPIGSIRLTES